MYIVYLPHSFKRQNHAVNLILHTYIFKICYGEKDKIAEISSAFPTCGILLGNMFKQ